VLRKWFRDIATDPVSAFPGHGQMKPGQLEIARLRRDVPKKYQQLLQSSGDATKG